MQLALGTNLGGSTIDQKKHRLQWSGKRRGERGAGESLCISARGISEVGKTRDTCLRSGKSPEKKITSSSRGGRKGDQRKISGGTFHPGNFQRGHRAGA